MRGSCAAAACLCALGCGPPPVFVCDGDASCGSAGVCEPSGYCSFPDADCPSGRRYGGLASAELANACVGASEATGEGTATTMVASSDGSTTAASTESSTAMVDASGSSGSVTGASSSSSESSSSESGTTGVVPTEGLILHLPLDDAFVITAGANDASGNELHATCDLCPTSERGRVGGAAGFAGQAVLVVADDPLLRPEMGFTVSVWALDADPSSMVTQFVIGKALTGVYNTFQLSTSAAAVVGEPDELVWRLTESPPAHHAFFIPNPLEPDTWHHLAGVWDGSISTLYVDGEVVGSVKAPAVGYDIGPLLVGADYNDGMYLYWWNGMIDEVRLYDRALSAADITALASE